MAVLEHGTMQFSLFEPLECRRLFAGSLGEGVAVPPPTMMAQVANVVAPKRLFMLGNSMTDGTRYAGLQQLLARDGSSVTYGRQTGSGYTQSQNLRLVTPLYTSGYDPARPSASNPWGNYQQAFDAGQWDFLTLQLHERRFGTDVVEGFNEAEIPMSLEFMRRFAANSPNAQPFIYSRPARRTDINQDLSPTGQPFDYSTEWMKQYVDSDPTNIAWYSRSYLTQVMPQIRQAQSQDAAASSLKPARLIPAGEVYYRIDQQIKAGLYAGTGVHSMLAFYADQSHPTDIASYALALTFYSAITGADPRGVTPPSIYTPSGSPLLNTKVQSLVQQAVYDAMTHSDYSAYVTPIATRSTASISGRVWTETDADGVLEPGESLLKDKIVFIDTDRDGVMDTGEPRATTDANGRYQFNNLPDGTYRVGRTKQNGYWFVNPLSGYHEITLNGADVTTADIGTANKPPATTPPPVDPPPTGSTTASIGGFVWTETDADGVYEAGESLLKDKTVFIDLDRDGVMDSNEPRKITDAQGRYRFDNLAPGNYRVGRAKVSGYWFVNPVSGFNEIALNGVSVTNANIGTANRAPTSPPPVDPPPTEPPQTTGGTLQAENATLSGGTVKATNHPGYTGTGFADFAGQGSAIQFALQRGESGVVDLQFRYANGSTANRPLQIVVNGSVVGTIPCNPTGAWTNWGVDTLAGVTLPAGAVTIRVVASTSTGGANVDSMTLIAPGSTPTQPTPPPTTPTGTLSWTTAANLPQGKAEAFGGAIGGKLYVFGGYIDNTFKPTTSAHVYDPSSNSWSAIASLPVAISHAATAFDARYMYYAGGYPATSTAQTFATTNVYRFDSVTETYQALPSLPSARGAASGAIVNGVFYVVGGTDSSRADRTEMWALDLNNLAAGWVQKASLPHARNHAAAIGLGGFVHFIGGDTGHDDTAVKHATHWRYDPATNTWATLAPLPSGRSHVTNSILVHNGATLSLGGEGDNEAKLSRVDRYDPATNAWSPLTSLPSPRFSGVADLIDGKIYFAGGYNSTFEKATWIGAFA